MHDLKLNAELGPRGTRRIAMITIQAFSIANFRGPLVQELVRQKVKVFALAPDFDDATRAAVIALGAIPVDCPIARSGMNPLRDVFDFARLALQLRRLKPDLAFASYIKPVIYGTLAARLAGVPKRICMIEGAGYVFTENNTPSFRRRLLRSFVIWMYKFGLSQASHVFLLNPDDKQLFVGEGMVSSEKVQLVDGIGLDLAHFQPAPPLLQPICFLFVARLLREKGVYDFIEAARKIKSIHSSTRFLILGSVDLNPGSIAESEVRAWVSEGLIEWPGQVSDVRPWIAQASVFVLPSYREGLPRSTQEAMAMSRPVITSNSPGCRETVLEGLNGFLVPICEPEALAQAMLRFIKNPELIISMGAESRRMAEKRFDVHKINAQIIASMNI